MSDGAMTSTPARACDKDCRMSAATASDRPRKQVVVVPGFVAVFGFLAAVDGGKQGDARDAEVAQDAALLDQEVDAETRLAGHRGEGLALVFALDDEKGLDQI